MPVFMTFFALLSMAALACAVRLLWPRASSAFRRTVLAVTGLLLLPTLLLLTFRWETTNLRLNASVEWAFLFAYLLALALFTLLRPRALTSLIALVLLLPVFSSSVVGPLGGSLYTGPPVIKPIADGYYLELIPWSSGPGKNSGVDFALFYRPNTVHHFRRSFLGMRLYDSQCQTRSTFATLDSTSASIDVHCPPLTSDPAAPPSGTEHHVVIPPGARSPALSQAGAR